MTQPRSTSANNVSRTKGQNNKTARQKTVTPSKVASTSTAVASPIAGRTQHSQDGLTMAESVPGAPLAPLAPTPPPSMAVPVAQVSPTQTPVPRASRRGIFQRLFGRH
ncbi:uncharacterized protein DMAD_00350 [Drosophila madeirensis]|uniref:Uncharacterized protein n=1 Tax=Drosophila madeirensis TaxID=30013 RepID=A0AAU9FY28_DROMD